MDEIDTFLAFIDAARAKNNDESDRAFSLRTTGAPDTIRDVRRKQALPGTTKLSRIADNLNVTIDQLLGRAAPADKPTAITSEVRVGDAVRGFTPFPNGNLPVLGTAHGGTINIGVNGDALAVETTLFEPTQVIRYITRPAALAQVKTAYAVYVVGESMSPRFDPGELAVVDPRIPPRIGDDVIVQLVNDEGDIDCILIKRLARRSGSFVELEQYNPAATFRLDTTRIAHLHRVLPSGELLGA